MATVATQCSTHFIRVICTFSNDQCEWWNVINTYRWMEMAHVCLHVHRCFHCRRYDLLLLCGHYYHGLCDYKLDWHLTNQFHYDSSNAPDFWEILINKNHDSINIFKLFNIICNDFNHSQHARYFQVHKTLYIFWFSTHSHFANKIHTHT